MLSPNSKRDQRLDLLRGLCLVNMVLVHLVNEGLAVPWAVREILMHWLRFAAGGFIFTSGLCIGAIHYQRALDPVRRGGIYRSLVRRSGGVLLMHYFATFLSLLLIPIRGWPVQHAPAMIEDVLRFRIGYDLLLFYVIMLLAAPLLIELRRRIGFAAVLTMAAGVFFIRFDSPHLGLYAIENDFPVLRWQLLFVAGLLAGADLPRFDATPVRVRWAMMGGALATAMSISTLAALENVGAIKQRFLTSVTKLPLSPLEALRYIALTIFVGLCIDRVHKWLSRTMVGTCLASLGAASLLLWIVHVPVVANLVTLPWLIAIPTAIASLWLAASIRNRVVAWSKQTRPTFATLSKLTPAFGSLAIAALLLRLDTPAPPAIMPPMPMNESIVSADDDPLEIDDDVMPMPIPVDDDSMIDVT